MIWCVEDDSRIREIEVYALNSAGFETRDFENGKLFWDAIQSDKPELILLDVMLPEIDGLELLLRLKKSSEFKEIPVIMATAKGEEYDRIKGLDLGADDYIVKPFSMMEMVSRVKAVLRRTKPHQDLKTYTYNDLVLKVEEHTVTIDQKRIELTYKEFELLRIFLSRQGMVFSREQLFTQVWKTDYMGDSRTLDMHIRTLRQKLGEYASNVKTVRNVGYRWEATDDK